MREFSQHYIIKKGSAFHEKITSMLNDRAAGIRELNNFADKYFPHKANWRAHRYSEGVVSGFTFAGQNPPSGWRVRNGTYIPTKKKVPDVYCEFMSLPQVPENIFMYKAESLVFGWGCELKKLSDEEFAFKVIRGGTVAPWKIEDLEETLGIDKKHRVLVSEYHRALEGRESQNTNGKEIENERT